MCFFFSVPVPNTNPSLGPVQGNKQSISVYDSKLGNHRTIVATPEECENFIKERNAANKQGSAAWAGISALGAVAGAGIGTSKAKSDMNALNELVDKANKVLKEELGKIKVDDRAWVPNEMKDFSRNLEISSAVDKAARSTGKFFDIKELYDNATKSFKKLEVPKTKELACSGALLGLCAGVVIGGLALIAKRGKKVNAITEEFIAKHNQVQKTEKE